MIMGAYFNLKDLAGEILLILTFLGIAAGAVLANKIITKIKGDK